MTYSEQELADRLLAILSQQSVVRGYSRMGGRSGAQVTVTLPNNQTIQATAVGAFPPGDCLAILDPDTQEWFTYSAHAEQVTRSQTYRRQARIQPQEVFGVVKVLFSVINGTNRDFYIGGDRATPQKIFSFPADNSVTAAFITNLGNRPNDWIVSLRYQSPSFVESIKIIKFGFEATQEVDYATFPNINAPDVNEPLLYKGRGTWRSDLNPFPIFLAKPYTDLPIGTLETDIYADHPLLNGTGSATLTGIGSGLPSYGPESGFSVASYAWNFLGDTAEFVFSENSLGIKRGTVNAEGSFGNCQLGSDFVNVFFATHIIPGYLPIGETGSAHAQVSIPAFITPQLNKESLTRFDYEMTGTRRILVRETRLKYNCLLLDSKNTNALVEKQDRVKTTLEDGGITTQVNTVLNSGDGFYLMSNSGTEIKLQFPLSINYNYSNLISNKLITVPSIVEAIAKNTPVELTIHTIQNSGQVIESKRNVSIFSLRSKPDQVTIHSASAYL